MEKDKETGVVPKLDEKKLIQIVTNLKKLAVENQKLRAKYPDNPGKFAANETDLFATLDQLQAVGTQHELYHVLNSKDVAKLLLSLLEHENTDVSGKVVRVITELVQFEFSDKNRDTDRFVKRLKEGALMDILVDSLDRYDKNKKEEAEVIDDSINVILAMIDVHFYGYGGHMYAHLFQKWAIKQLKKTKFNFYKLSMIDLLNTLLMDGENVNYFCKDKGVNALLLQIAYYRKTVPETPSEIEYISHLLLCLSQLLLDHEDYNHTRESFFKSQGVELLELILKEKGDGIMKSPIKFLMIRAFNNAVTSSSNYETIVTKMCERFVEVLGLKVLFPMFLEPKLMIPKDSKKKHIKAIIDETEENTVGIILALLKHCQNTEYIQRILVKFAEKEFEKFNRLIELQEKYHKLLKDPEPASKKQKTGDNGDQVEEEDDDEEVKVHPSDEELDKTHFNLQQVNYIFLMICYLSEQYETYDPNSGEKFSSRLERLLKIEKPQLKEQILENSKSQMDDLPEESKQEKNSISFLVDHLEKFCSKFTASE